jgi:hypothetical protein
VNESDWTVMNPIAVSGAWPQLIKVILVCVYSPLTGSVVLSCGSGFAQLMSLKLL